MPELTRRYVVMTMAAAAPFDPTDRDAPFVLKPWKDPAALAALKSYRDHCYTELARDLDEWIRLVETGPLVHGDVGRRNDEHLKSVAAAPPAAPRRRGGPARRTSASPRGRGKGGGRPAKRRAAPKRRGR